MGHTWLEKDPVSQHDPLGEPSYLPSNRGSSRTANYVDFITNIKEGELVTRELCEHFDGVYGWVVHVIEH
jgi:hypothetical protein